MTSRRLLIALTVALAAAPAVSARAAEASAQTWPGCDAYRTQPQAQQAWEGMGRPARADADHDGVVCESLPAAEHDSGTSQCTRTRKVIIVNLDARKYPHILAHARRVIRKGQPRILTINRPGAEQRRARLLADIPTKPGYDRDEYSPAAGRATWRADVEYVPSAENRSAGSVMGNALRSYCDGVRFRYAGV